MFFPRGKTYDKSRILFDDGATKTGTSCVLFGKNLNVTGSRCLRSLRSVRDLTCMTVRTLLVLRSWCVVAVYWNVGLLLAWRWKSSGHASLLRRNHTLFPPLGVPFLLSVQFMDLFDYAAECLISVSDVVQYLRFVLLDGPTLASTSECGFTLLRTLLFSLILQSLCNCFDDGA